MSTGFSRPPLALLVAALCLALAVARTAAAQAGQTAGRAPLFAVHISDEATGDTLRRVLEGARERLADPRCESLLDVFTGRDGRPLRDHLEESRRSAADYLGLIVFYDGAKHRLCEKRGVLAVAVPGGRIVYVCPKQLRERARRNPLWAEATLIHEALHTLGLGENPPSSQEITTEVIRRCRH